MKMQNRNMSDRDKTRLSKKEEKMYSVYSHKSDKQ